MLEAKSAVLAGLAGVTLKIETSKEDIRASTGIFRFRRVEGL